jgi:hypothetical protein
MAMATVTAVRSETRTDEEIQRDVLAELKWDARVQPNEIGVSVKDGVVTLTGVVDSYSKRWAAEDHDAAHAEHDLQHRASAPLSGVHEREPALGTVASPSSPPSGRAAPQLAHVVAMCHRPPSVAG